MLKEVKIELTNKCPRNCKHCSSSATSDNRNLKDLDFNNVSKIIREAKLMGVEAIVFTGGEPLMYNRLPELVKLTSSLGMKSTIYSFAYRNDQTLKQYRTLIKNGLNKIIYSLADTLSDEEELSTYEKGEFRRLGLDFKRIGNRSLQLIDWQNIFCELDKYCRQALPDLKANTQMKNKINFLFRKKVKKVLLV